MAQTSYFADRLNPQQLAAVDKIDGPLLILAGAGSGKTRVLTHRLANIVLQNKARPDEILAVTFTNKAAAEMLHRAENILQSLGVTVVDRIWVSTFHSTCVRILRDHVELLGYKRNFIIYDASDQLSLIKKVATALDYPEKDYPAKNFAYRIRHAKMEGKTPEQVAASKDFYMDERSLAVFRRYEEEMFRANAMDFDDLLLKTLLLLEQFPKVLQAYQRRFRYIMVDEYQDTNSVQYRLLQLLAKEHKNLCVVGDEDQSIYSWRGADISNILNFEFDYPQAMVVKLEENYRSTQTIVDAASHVIAKNEQRKGKKLFSNKEAGDKIEIREEEDDREEARFVVRRIQNLAKQHSYKDMAVFYRNNSQSRVLEEQLRLQQIPYKIIGGLRFYDRLEIKDALSYLRLLINPGDDVALKRIINVPARGIGKTTVQKIEDYAMDQRLSMLQACDQLLNDKAFNAGTAKKLYGFLSLIADLAFDVEHRPASDLLSQCLEQSGYLAQLQKDESPEAAGRLDNLQELSNAILQFEKDRGSEASLSLFLEEMALASDQDAVDSQQDCVHLMTLHVSKGLEFPFVFIVGCEEGIFPSGQAVESGESNEIEEERRLAYVGFTRAMQALYLSYARRRRMWGQTQFNPPSRFLAEIPKKYIASPSSKNSSSSFRSQRDSGFASFTRQGDFSVDDFIDKEWSVDAPTPSYSFEDVASQSFYTESISPSPSANKSLYQKGQRVRHPQFGIGSIYEVKGQGDKAKLTVVFDGNFLKMFVAKYSKLEKI